MVITLCILALYASENLCKWKNIIKVDSQSAGYEYVDWIQLRLNKAQWIVSLNMKTSIIIS
jgi:predicted component of type VI protein secretion system